MPNTSGIRAGRAFVELGVSDRLTAGLRRAQRRLQTFGNSVRAIGTRLTAISAGVGAGFALSTRVFAGFDDRMRVVRAVTGATEQQFESLREEAKRLGRTTSFTAGQVAEAMTELGRAGFDPQAILDSTEAVLALAGRRVPSCRGRPRSQVLRSGASTCPPRRWDASRMC